jgi:hypothetical protein
LPASADGGFVERKENGKVFAVQPIAPIDSSAFTHIAKIRYKIRLVAMQMCRRPPASRLPVAEYLKRTQ